jgi:amino acid permease
MSTQNQSSAAHFKYILLSPFAAKLLSATAVGNLYLWFALKFFLTDESTTLSVIVGLVGLSGIIFSIVVFLCTYSFVANAPKQYLDERELQERNAAYMSAYVYTVTLLLIGYLGTDLIGKVYSGFQVTPEVVRNYLNVAFFTSLIMPATILAWRDRNQDEE